MSWAPNETAHELLVERANLAGSHMESTFYGIHFVLFSMCVRELWRCRAQSPKRSSTQLAYIILVFTLSSIGNIARIRRTEECFIDNRNFPGGPVAYLLNSPPSAAPLNILDSATFCMTTWLADGLLLYRFFVIWGRQWLICVPPVLSFLLSIVSSCFFISSIDNGETLWQNSDVDFALMFWCSTIGTTIYATMGIAGKLLHVRYQLLKAFGPEHESPYFSITTMVVESALLNTTFQILLVALYASGNAMNIAFLGVTTQMTSISMVLIVLRVARGSALSEAKLKQSMSRAANRDAIPLTFRPPATRTLSGESQLNSRPETDQTAKASAMETSTSEQKQSYVE